MKLSKIGNSFYILLDKEKLAVIKHATGKDPQTLEVEVELDKCGKSGRFKFID